MKALIHHFRGEPRTSEESGWGGACLLRRVAAGGPTTCSRWRSRP